MFIVNIVKKIIKYSLLMIFFVGIGVCNADKIELTNGNSMNGIISREAKKYIVLDLGTGLMNLDRKYIKSINYSGDYEREEIKRQWQKKYFLNKKFIPAGYEDVVAEYNNLLLKRNVAARAVRAIKSSERKEAVYNKELVILKKKYEAVNLKLREVNKDTDMLRYNELIREVNSLVASINIKVGQIEKNISSAGNTAVISEYLSELSQFKGMIYAHKASLPASVESSVVFFYEGLSKKITKLDEEFSRDVIASKQRGRSTLVTVFMNDKVSGTFVLDTGAELVTITEKFAGRLGINMESLPLLDITVADGRMLKGRAVVLDSIRLGNSSSKNIPAVILPGNEQSGYDGLLGMSFLRDYIVQFDGASGKLTLRKLNNNE